MATDRQICGEVTPEYSLLPGAGVAHIVRLMANVRIILSLRDPIERSWSDMRMLANRSGGASHDQLKRLATEFGVRERGDRPRMLSPWSRYIPSSRLLIVLMDDIAANPGHTMQAICDFLGIEFRAGFFPMIEKRIHPGREMPVPPDIYELLRQGMRVIYDELQEWLPETAQRWSARHYAESDAGRSDCPPNGAAPLEPMCAG